MRSDFIDVANFQSRVKQDRRGLKIINDVEFERRLNPILAPVFVGLLHVIISGQVDSLSFLIGF